MNPLGQDLCSVDQFEYFSYWPAITRKTVKLAVTFILLLYPAQLLFAQRQNYTLYGDVKVDESQITDRMPSTFDVLLYKNGNLVGRQKLGNNGRYRFMNLTAGLFEVVIEFEGVEAVRVSKLIAGSNYSDDTRLDINLVWRPLVEKKPLLVGAVSVADSHLRNKETKALFKRAAKEIEAKEYGEATKYLQELVTLDPKDHPAWFELGVVYFIRKEYEQSEKCFATAVAVEPAYLAAMLNLGRVRLAQKNYPGAEEALLRTLKIDARNAAASYFLAETYLQLKQGSLAVQYYNNALKIDPIGMAEAHLRLALLYNRAGYREHAVQEYEQFLSKKPKYAQRKKLEDYIAANKPKPADSPK
jgi:tetratricopeptide (TPR) repeat protein